MPAKWLHYGWSSMIDYSLKKSFKNFRIIKFAQYKPHWFCGLQKIKGVRIGFFGRWLGGLIKSQPIIKLTACIFISPVTGYHPYRVWMQIGPVDFSHWVATTDPTGASYGTVASVIGYLCLRLFVICGVSQLVRLAFILNQSCLGRRLGQRCECFRCCDCLFSEIQTVKIAQT